MPKKIKHLKIKSRAFDVPLFLYLYIKAKNRSGLLNFRFYFLCIKNDTINTKGATMNIKNNFVIIANIPASVSINSPIFSPLFPLLLFFLF